MLRITYGDFKYRLRGAQRCRSLASVICMALAVNACGSAFDATPPPFVSEPMRAGFGTVGIVSVPPAMPDALELPPEKGQAIIEGVLIGALEGLTAGGGGDGEAALIIGLVLAPIGAVAGGVKGARENMPGDVVRQTTAGVKAAILAARERPSMAARIYHHARIETGGAVVMIPPPPKADEDSRRTLAGRAEIDTLIEISNVVVTLESVGGDTHDPKMWMQVKTRVRMRRSNDGAVFYDHTRGWGVRERHKLTEWVADDGRLIREGIERTRQTLSRKIAEDLFLVYHDERAKAPESSYGVLGNERPSTFPSLPPRSRLVWGLAPVSPHVGKMPVTVDSLQPTFSWRPFPGYVRVPAPDGEGEPELLPFVPVDPDRAKKVRYELQIRTGSDLIYQRRNIAEPRHTLEAPLQPGKRYRWAIRAWFEIDGKQRVSEWSQLLYRERDEAIRTAGWRGFFFKTPDG